MSNTRKVLLGIGGVYLLGIVLLIAVFGATSHKNNAFQIQNEFKLVNWVSLGVLSINRAVLYLFLAAILTVVTVLFVANRMQTRPNRVQTAVEAIFSLMRDNITRGNMPDSLAAEWFPFLGTLFLFIWYCNLIGYLPLPTNSEEKFNLFGAHIPSFALYAATANVSVPLILALVVFISFNAVGIRARDVEGFHAAGPAELVLRDAGVEAIRRQAFVALQQAEPRRRHDEVHEAGHRADAARAVLAGEALGRLDLEAHGAAMAAAAIDHGATISGNHATVKKKYSHSVPAAKSGTTSA